MADDRMKNDDLQRNMGAGDKGQNYGGQQSPGRSGQGGEQAGQHAGGQKSGGGQHGTQNIEDDEEDFGAGRTGQTGRQNRGGQNR
ncbi:MAG TPA: hypothetical protein VGP59_07470 [Pyrinomonadaceae bacterium]|nr:hypothetical protein [Pyrinomonadaceae bacterium]